AWPLAELAEFERSALLLGSGLAFLDRSGAKREWTDEACEAAVCKILRDEFDDPTAQALLNEGRQVPLERAAREALNASSALTVQDICDQAQRGLDRGRTRADRDRAAEMAE
ncbi:MAG TPA: hypothetical protein VGH93_04390, partial [Solirubrobacteraceae bacterium]